MSHPPIALDLVIARIIDPLVAVRPTSAVVDAQRLLHQRLAPALPVIEGTTQVGSISAETADSLGYEGGALLVREVMEPPLGELDEHATLADVAAAIALGGAVLVTRESFPIGLLSAEDVRDADGTRVG
jgi:predicted transcriptional regulator